MLRTAACFNIIRAEQTSGKMACVEILHLESYRCISYGSCSCG